MDPITFHSMGKKILWKSMGSINYLVSDILQSIFFKVFSREINVWNNLRVSTFIFG